MGGREGTFAIPIGHHLKYVIIYVLFEGKVWRAEVGDLMQYITCTDRHFEGSLMDSFIFVRYDPSAKDHGQRNDQVLIANPYYAGTRTR